MTKECILGIFVAAAFVLQQGSASETAVQHDGDPVLVALKAYDAAVDEFRKLENPSIVTRMAHYKEWKEHFQGVLTENPHSRYGETARVKLLGLSNGLGDFSNSQMMLHEMISQASSPVEKIRWLNELGEVSRARYRDTQDRNEAQKSLDAFERAHDLYLQLPMEIISNEISGRQIVSLCMAGDISRVFKDHVQSATLFQSARELFQVSTEAAMVATFLRYDLESITDQEMVEWIHAREESNALNCLETLSKLHLYRWTPSYYALKYATLWYKGNPSGFQNFASKWLDKNAFDERTPIFMARIGFSYFDTGLFDKALPIYETLRDKHRGDFQRLEPDAFQSGRGGHYERVLYDLATIYTQRGDTAKAENMKTELTTLLPDSDFGKFLTDTSPSSSEDWIMPEPARYLGFRIFFAITGIVLILYGLYLRWRKE